MKKKILTFVAVAASLMPAAAQKLTDTADSLGYYIGATQGVLFNSRFDSEVEKADQKKYKEEFLKGFKATLLADTSRAAYRRGQAVGLSMTDEFRRMREAGQQVDTKVLYETFAKYLTAADVNEETYRELYNELIPLMQPTKDYYDRKAQEAQQAEEAKRQAVIDANIAAGKKFMDDLKANDPDVKFTESGLGYKVIRQGEGPNIARDGDGMVRYVGKLVDGTQFDSSGDQAYRFGPRGVIQGFGEGLMLMNKGSKYILYIPQEIAYGIQGPPAIGPAQTLIFEVEIDDVMNPDQSK